MESLQTGLRKLEYVHAKMWKKANTSQRKRKGMEDRMGEGRKAGRMRAQAPTTKHTYPRGHFCGAAAPAHGHQRSETSPRRHYGNRRGNGQISHRYGRLLPRCTGQRLMPFRRDRWDRARGCPPCSVSRVTGPRCRTSRPVRAGRSARWGRPSYCKQKRKWHIFRRSASASDGGHYTR